MKLSEYIKRLESIKAAHGDLRVTVNNHNGVVDAPVPDVKYVREKRPREWKRYYWYAFDKESAVEKVVAI